MEQTAQAILLAKLSNFSSEVKAAIKSLITQFNDLNENFSAAVKMIDVLVKKLKIAEEKIFELENPTPHVEIIDEKHCRFNNEIYRKNKRSGYYVCTKTLHNAVYQFYNKIDKIPKGYVIHHNGKDENGNYTKEKNDIEYLILMERGKHTKLHSQTELNQKKTFTCRICGRKFQANNHGKNCICSRKCKLQAHKKYAPTYREIRKCKWCGKKFLADRHRSKGYCSNKCGSLAQWERYRQNNDK